MGAPSFSEYVPTKKQLEAHIAKDRYKFLSGGFGSGKSVWLCAEALQLSLEFPGNKGYLCRKTKKDFMTSTYDILMNMMPKGFISGHNKHNGVLTLVNGSIIQYGHLEDKEAIKSTEFGWIGIDEANNIRAELFDYAKGRLRHKVPVFGDKYPKHILLTSNPEPCWLKDTFVDPQRNGKPAEDHFWIHSVTRDNPHLDEKYVSELEKLPEVMRRKYVYGDWDAFDVQIFKPEWIKGSPSGIEYLDKFMAVDPAISSKETADESVICVMGVDRENNIHEIESKAGRWNFAVLKSMCVEMYQKHKPSLFGVESVAFQKALAEELISIGVPAIEMKPDGDKVRRAVSVSDLFEQGKVFINSVDMKKQLIEFPAGDHDDYVDAVVYCLKLYKGFGTKYDSIKDDPYGNLDDFNRDLWNNIDKQLNQEDDISELV